MSRVHLMREHDKAAGRVAGDRTLRLGDLLQAAIVTAIDRELPQQAAMPLAPKATLAAAPDQSPGARYRAMRAGEPTPG